MSFPWPTLCSSCSSSLWWSLLCSPRTFLWTRSEEHTSELQSPCNIVCRLLLEKKKNVLEDWNRLRFEPNQDRRQNQVICHLKNALLISLLELAHPYSSTEHHRLNHRHRLSILLL